MRRIIPILGLACLALVLGCIEPPPKGETTPAPKTNADLERQNEVKGETINKLEGELAAARAQRDELQQALDSTRKADTSGKSFEYEVSHVEFGFFTAPVNMDDEKVTDRKGDNGIAAYVNLYDQFDSSIKAAGEFQFDLMDLKRSKDFVIQTWTYEPEAAAKHWGRIPACYQFKLPLSSDVYAKNVVLKVTFRRAGKKDLTDTKELKLERPQ